MDSPITLTPLTGDACDLAVLTFTLPPNYVGKLHWHPADTVYIIRRGQFTVAGEGTYEVGDIRWVKAGTPYGPEGSRPRGLRGHSHRGGKVSPPDLRPRRRPAGGRLTTDAPGRARSNAPPQDAGALGQHREQGGVAPLGDLPGGLALDGLSEHLHADGSDTPAVAEGDEQVVKWQLAVTRHHPHGGVVGRIGVRLAAGVAHLKAKDTISRDGGEIGERAGPEEVPAVKDDPPVGPPGCLDDRPGVCECREATTST